MKKTALTAALCACAFSLFAEPPEITNVRAAQREGTKLVDIYYDAADADGDLLKVRVEISDNDGRRYSVPAFTFTGDIGENIAPGTGKHIIWNAGTDWDGEYSDQMRVKVFAIDAKGFPGMEWGLEVPPGGFLLGQDGGAEGSGPSRHVNIPWSYWLSKYEVTVQQYCDFLNIAYASGLVRRDGTSAIYTVAGNTVIPYHTGSYKIMSIGDGNLIRWNVNNFEVVGKYANYPVRVSWYGAALFAHYYGYDLPTSAEWEKAARGPDHDDQDEHLLYTWGNTSSSSYRSLTDKPVGYFDGNQTPIGPDTINEYGLYDMCGGASEWTRTRAYSTESYPQEENIYHFFHAYLGESSFIVRGDDRIYQKDNYSKINNTAGIRLARRILSPQPAATCEIFEDFETWSTTTYSSSWTYTANSGTWKTNSYIYRYSDSTKAASGSNYLYWGDSYSLTLPKTTGLLTQVKLKAKNISSEKQKVYLYGDTSCIWVSIPENSEYQTITFDVPQNATDYKISTSGSGICIDDIELWTVPK